MDADAAAPAALPVRPSSSVPRKSSLKPHSKSRLRSRAQTPSRDRSHSRLSPERDDFHRKKPVGSLPSSYFTGFISHDMSPKPVYQLDPNDPSWKDDFLAWTLRDTRKSWCAGERTWVNLHIALYLYDPTRKYPIAHPRAFAACSIAGDAALPERFCWSCQNITTGGTAKSLWPDMDSFTYHWHQVHASQLQTDWTELALQFGLTIDDLSWALLALDLLESPLPCARETLKAIPKVMPPKRDGHNKRIDDSPWYVHCPIMPMLRALPMPHPPSYPPPRHVLGSLNSTSGRSGYGSELVAVNKAYFTLLTTCCTFFYPFYSFNFCCWCHFQELFQCCCSTFFTICFCNCEGSWLQVPHRSCLEGVRSYGVLRSSLSFFRLKT